MKENPQITQITQIRYKQQLCCVFSPALEFSVHDFYSAHSV